MYVAGLARDFRGLGKIDSRLVVFIDDGGVILGKTNGLQEMAVVGNSFATAREGDIFRFHAAVGNTGSLGCSVTVDGG